MEQRTPEKKRTDNSDIDRLYERYGQRFRFPVYLGKILTTTPIEDLELSVRSYNCLRRAGLSTVGELVEMIDTRDDLMKIRNLGKRSADEIMDAILRYQYSIIPEEGKKKYLRRVEEMN